MPVQELAQDTETAADLSTAAIHAGTGPDPTTGAILPPIHQSTTFVHEAVGRHKGFTYSRTANPTVAALERRLAALEGAEHCTCFATGLAATTALALALLGEGERALVSDVAYGGTVRLFRQVLAGFGVEVEFVDGADLEALRAALAAGRPPRLLFVETPANPTLKLTDVAAAARLGKDAGAVVVVDNTLLTPALQRPLALGADVVLHSTTKFIEGHNATVGGALVTGDPALHERFDFLRNAIGAIQSPFPAWLTLQGVKTLPLRMARHSESALRVAQALERHPRVTRILYPGLPSFPQHELATCQHRAHGGLLAFEVEGGADGAVSVMNRVRLWALAENLGAVESLITHPATMTHAAVPREQRERTGITDGLIRLSVGLENPDDLLADLGRALEG